MKKIELVFTTYFKHKIVYIFVHFDFKELHVWVSDDSMTSNFSFFNFFYHIGFCKIIHTSTKFFSIHQQRVVSIFNFPIFFQLYYKQIPIVLYLLGKQNKIYPQIFSNISNDIHVKFKNAFCFVCLIKLYADVLFLAECFKCRSC